MPFYERGPVRIHYEEVGSGFPLLLIPGGGLNSSFQSWQTASPFKPMERYKDDFRCICADLRNANPGQSSGPLEIDRPWDAYTDDRSEEHTSELQSLAYLVCRLLLEKKKKIKTDNPLIHYKTTN